MESQQQNNPFDRQERIENWSQQKIANQVCLCLGTGGLGCTVAMSLARLGVKKIILLDKDVVDISNLNRQILFTHSDIGKSKCEVAKEQILRNHLINPNMIVESYNMCALQNWQKIVELSLEATVVFNMIDVGDYFDAAVQALCLVRQIPLIQGGTFCQQLTVDMFLPNQPCISCSSDTYDKEILKKILPSLITEVENLEFIPRNNNPIGQSNIYLCCICAEMMVARFSTILINDPEVVVNPRFIMTVNNGDTISFPIPKEEGCLFCKDIAKPTPQVNEEVVQDTAEQNQEQQQNKEEEVVAAIVNKEKKEEQVQQEQEEMVAKEEKSEEEQQIQTNEQQH